MDKTNSLVIGAGTVAGAASGYAIGASKGQKLISKIDENVLKAVKSQTLDEYVNSRVAANMERVHQLKQSKWAAQFEKIREKAGLDYDNVKNTLKQAKNTKIKFAAIFAVLGLALGAGIAALIGKKEA